MKKKISIVLLWAMALALLTCGCTEEIALSVPVNLSANTRVWVGVEQNPTATFKEAQVALALNLLKKTTTENMKNPMLGTYSVSVALALAANGADGDTEARFLKLLGASSLEELNGMMYNLRRNENGSLVSAQSVWLKDASGITDSYLETVKDQYGADVFHGITQQAVDAWVKEHTNEQIESLECNTDDYVQLLNATTLQAVWGEAFKTVEDGNFTDSEGKVCNVSMMKGKADGYISLNGGGGFIKNYEDNTISFAAFLPPEGVSVYDYIHELDAEALIQVLEINGGQPVNLTMPAFKAEADLTLTEAIKALGLAEDFTPAASFPAFGSGVCLDEVNHKAILELDQNGTRGAAASNAGIMKYSISEYKELVLDRPFVYMVFDKKSDAPLFIGAVTNF